MDPESKGTTPFVGHNPMHQQGKDQKKRSKKRKCLLCCGACSTIVIILLIILIILIFTVFKERDPKIHVDSVTLKGLSVNLGNIFTDPNLSVDLNLNTTLSVKNPNYAGFKYHNTTAYVYYRGKELADSPVPAGQVRARKTSTMSTVTDVHISGNIINANLSSDVNAGVLPLVATVQIKGTAKILGFISVKNVRTNALCNVNVFISNATESFQCKYKVKI